MNFQKDHSQDQSLLPGAKRGTYVAAATVQVLHQVEGTKVEHPGGIIGDARFGCVEAVLHCKKVMHCNSWFVVKGMTSCYPKLILQAILKAYSSKQAGICGIWVT